MGVSDAARTRDIACCGSCDLLPVDQYFITSSCCGFVVRLIMPRHQGGQFGIARSVRLSVPWRSCLGYRYAGCLQLSYRRPPEMCGLRPSADGRRSAAIFATVELPSAAAGAYRLADPGAILCFTANTRKIEARSLSMWQMRDGWCGQRRSSEERGCRRASRPWCTSSASAAAGERRRAVITQQSAVSTAAPSSAPALHQLRRVSSPLLACINQTNVDVRLSSRVWCCPQWVTSSIRHIVMSPRPGRWWVHTWRHPENQRYITYRNATRQGPSHGHGQCAQKIWRRRFDEWRTDRQTHQNIARSNAANIRRAHKSTVATESDAPVVGIGGNTVRYTPIRWYDRMVFSDCAWKYRGKSLSRAGQFHFMLCMWLLFNPLIAIFNKLTYFRTVGARQMEIAGETRMVTKLFCWK